MHAHEAGAVHADATSGPAGIGGPPADLNALDAHVWPAGVQRGTDGVVQFAGHDIRDLAIEHATPSFLLDEADFAARLNDWQNAFRVATDGHADVYYAGKAFLSKAVVRWVEAAGLNLDVCTGGELATAIAAEFPPARLALHGNNKSVAELTQAVTVGIGTVVVDSFEELARLAAIADEHDVVQPILMRVTLGVEAHTHDFIATAHEDQKFGFSMASGAAEEAVRRALKLTSLEVRGLHSHIGSQIFDMAGFEVAAHRIVELLARIRDEHDRQFPVLDLGGGLGIAYSATDDPQTPDMIAASLTAIVRRECAANSLDVPRLAVEPGRAIAGPPTLTLYTVGTIKPVETDTVGTRVYVSVDGGMSDNIRTSLYDADYTCALVSRSSDASPMLTRVVGKHCESGDIVVRDAWLPSDLAPGDLLAVAATGAYCRSMASNYNHVPRPPVVAVTTGGTRVIVRRETVEDLLATDVG